MTKRPLPIEPPTAREIDAGWSAIKAKLDEGGAVQWRWAWGLAAVLLFVGITAGATVLVRELRERHRIEQERREAAHAQEPAPAAPSTEGAGGGTGTGSLSPVVPAADENAAADNDPRSARRDSPRQALRAKSQGKAHAGNMGGGGSTAAAGGSSATSSGDGAGSSGRGYSPLAGMSPKASGDAEPDDETSSKTDDGGDAFAAGSAARARGDFGAALGHYERFVAKHPHDERAGIAAIEAARILADHLEQPAKALRWAERAVELSSEGSVREDARARVVHLLGVLKRTRCLTARRDFLRDYPNSVHAPRVQRACGEAP